MIVLIVVFLVVVVVIVVLVIVLLVMIYQKIHLQSTGGKAEFYIEYENIVNELYNMN